MLIALDLDGTIRDFIGELNYYYDLDFPNETRSEVVKTWELENSYSIGKKIYDYAFVKRGCEIMTTARIYMGAVAFVKELAKNHEIVLATSQRNMACKLGTLEWINKYDLPHVGIFFSDKKELLRADILIDDYHKNLNAFAETGRKAICINRPWNQHVEGWNKNVSFAQTYTDVLDVVRYNNESR